MRLVAAHKPTVDARLGVSLEHLPDGRIIVARVAGPNDERPGIFANTDLRVGMEIVLVNDAPCQGNLTAATKALKYAPAGALRLHVIDNQDSSGIRKQQHHKHTDVVAPGAVEVSLEPQHMTAARSRRIDRSFSRKHRQQYHSFSPPPPDPVTDRKLLKSRSQIPVGRTHTILVPHTKRLGVRLQDVDNGVPGVQVGRIDDDSVLAGTQAQVGMRLLHVNDTPCTSVAQVSELLRKPSDGLLRLVVQEVEPVVRRSRSSFAAISTNQQETKPDDLSDRISRYKSANEDAQRAVSPSFSIISSTVYKTTAAQTTGVRLKETPDRRGIRIDRVARDSDFATSTALAVGQELTAVNERPTEGHSVQEVASWIRETQGVLTLTTTMMAGSTNRKEEKSKHRHQGRRHHHHHSKTKKSSTDKEESSKEHRNHRDDDKKHHHQHHHKSQTKTHKPAHEKKAVPLSPSQGEI